MPPLYAVPDLPKGGAMEISDAYEAYADWLREFGASDNTVRQRVRLLRHLTEKWGRLDVPTSQVVAWLADYQGWSRRTYVAHLRSIYAWMMETGQLTQSPLHRYRRPPTPRPNPQPLTAGEFTAALDTTDARLRAWLLLGALAGLRAHEIAKFHGRDITERMLFVHGKGGQDAVLPTHPALWVLAEGYPRDEFWFPSPRSNRDHVHESLVSNVIRDRFREVGITSGAAHRLRYSYGTNLANDGTPIRVVQELLRHRSLETTMRYVGVSDEQMRAAIGRLAA